MLNKTEREIITHRFGIYHGGPRTNEEIVRMVKKKPEVGGGNYTRERLRQLGNRALKKLRPVLME